MSKSINNNQELALIIPFIPVLGIMISILTEPFRIIPNYHWIYSFGKMTCFLLWFIGIIWAFINAILIIQLSSINLKEKFLWLIVNFSIIIIFLITVLFSL